MAANGQEQLSLQTLEGLEGRLKQIEFFITGGEEYEEEGFTDAPLTTNERAPQDRLRRIEERLAGLTTKNKVAADILNLHSKHPELFPEDLASDDTKAYTTEEKYDIVNACATVFPSTASRLTSIKDTPVPSAEDSTALTSLQPQLAKVELQQEQWLERIADLRLRTALVCQRWMELSVISTNECWTEWHERLMEVEKIVRRHEAIRAEESQTV